MEFAVKEAPDSKKQVLCHSCMDKWVTRLDLYGRAVWASALCDDSPGPGMVSIEEHSLRLLEPGEGLAGYGAYLAILRNLRVVGYIEVTDKPQALVS
jgi:hypothetical protein